MMKEEFRTDRMTPMRKTRTRFQRFPGPATRLLPWPVSLPMALLLALGHSTAGAQAPPAPVATTAPEAAITPAAPDAPALDDDGPTLDPGIADEPVIDDALEGPESPIALNPEDVDRIRVDADHFDANRNEAGDIIVTASGHVRATMTRDEGPGIPPTNAVITSDTLMANMATRTVTARGNVTLISGERMAMGQSLEYRWQEGTGRFEAVVFRMYGFTFRAGALEIAAKRQAVTKAEFSTCGLDDPDFLVSADSIVIVPNKRIEARGVTVEVFQHRVIKLPRLQYRLRKGNAQARQALPVARPGYSQRSGFSLAQPIPIGESLDAEIEPTTRAGLRGRLLYQPDAPLAPYAELSWKQEMGVRDRRPVLVSRLPVVGLRLGRNEEVDVNAGYFREHDTGTHEGRVHLAYQHAIVDRGTRPGVVLRVGGRASLYTTGDLYREVHAEVAVGRGGDDTFEEIGVRLNDIGGDDPFLWDRVQIRTEAFGAKRIAMGDYRLEGAVRYDVGNADFYDVQVAVGKRFKCLEPEIRYSTRSRSVSLGLRVFGIGAREAPTSIAPVVPAPGS